MSDSPDNPDSHSREVELLTNGEQCREPNCEQMFASMDQLVDHMTDEHDAFTWVTRGCPVNE